MSTLGQRVITTPSGLRIGCAYTPKPQPMSRDAEIIQKALLRPKRLGRLFQSIKEAFHG